jgi:hypothetical protein
VSRKPENTFIASVHRRLPRDLHAEKMANPYRGGTADVWYSGKKADLWIEYKFIERIPLRAPIEPNLSELQKLWLRRRYEEGRNVAVVVGCKEGGIILRNLEWEAMIPPEKFRQQLVTRDAIADWILTVVSERSEAGAEHDPIYSGDLQGAGKAPQKSGRQPANLRGPVRAQGRTGTGRERQPRL